MRKRGLSLVLCAILILGCITAANAKTTIRFWTSHVNPDISKWYDDEVIPAFEKLYPDIQVEWLSLTWEERHQKIMTAFAAGTAPDIIASGTEQIYDEVLNNLARPIDEFVEEWGEYDDYFQVAWDNQTMGGKIYRVPTVLSARGIMYNKGHFADVGLDPEAAPETWEELAAAAKKLNILRGKRTIRLGADLWPIHNFNQGFTYFLVQNGGDLLSPDNTKPVINTPEAIETAEFLVGLYRELQPDGTASLSTSGAIPVFPAGQVSITVANPQTVRDVEKYGARDLEVGFALPGRKQKAIHVFGNGIYITTQSKYPKEAWEFIKFLMSEENQAKFNNLLFSINPRKSAIDDPFVTSRPLLRDWYEPMDKYGKLFPIMPENARLHATLRQEIEAACYGQQTPEQAMKNAADKWAEILSEAAQMGGILSR